MVDLEQSIRYALTTEIPTQQLLDENKMKAIFQYLLLVRQLRKFIGKHHNFTF